MPEPPGHYIPLSLPRRFVSDLLHFAKKTPLVTLQRRMSLAPLAAARQASNIRPSWVALFLKAFGRVAAAYPELRRCYLPYPWPRLYEHPRNVASIAIERRFRNELGVFIANLPELEKKSLAELDTLVRRYKEEPVEKVGAFRRILRISRLPRPLRHLTWWMALNFSGRLRARYLGTFGFSAVANLGSSIHHILSPLTTTLSYGVLSPDGSVDVYLTWDHRVLDGATLARAMEDMEQVLLGEVLTELRSAPTREAA
jgi:hypothetical protein